MRRTLLALALSLTLIAAAGCTAEKTGITPPGSAPQTPGQQAAASGPQAGPAGKAATPGESPQQTSVAREQGARVPPIVPAFPESRTQQRVVGLKPIHFAFDSAGLSPENQQVLEANAAWLRAHPTAVVRVEGHCDERGSSAYNLGLGLRRSHQVRDFLRAAGIGGERLHPVTLGEEVPLRREHNEAAYHLNRRVEFALVERTALLEK